MCGIPKNKAPQVVPQLVEGKKAEYNNGYDWMFLAAAPICTTAQNTNFIFYTALFTGVKRKTKGFL